VGDPARDIRVALMGQRLTTVTDDENVIKLGFDNDKQITIAKTAVAQHPVDPPDEQCHLCGSAGEMYIHGRCHPTAATWAVLREKRVDIECCVCQRLITTFDIAEATHV
jgi:hypothetical protein